MVDENAVSVSGSGGGGLGVVAMCGGGMLQRVVGRSMCDQCTEIDRGVEESQS